MKIFVNARFLTQPLSGVQRYAIECSRQINKLYPEVTFIAPKNILHREIAAELNVRTMGYNTGHLWEQIDLPLYLARQKYPRLLNLANTAPLLYSKNYVTIHDLAFFHHPEWNSKKFSIWYNILIPRVALGARHIFTVSQTVRKEIVESYHIAADKISITYNGISAKMQQHGPCSGLSKDKIILAVGTFSIRKNHPALITAFLKSNLRDEYQLVIIGDRNKIFNSGVLPEGVREDCRIKIVETMDEEDLIKIYRNAEVVASLSLYEGFGIPVLEGLYNGCKVVCSDIPVYRELFDGNVFFCDPVNINKIEEALEQAVKGKSMDIHSISTLTEQFSYQKSAQVILEQVLRKQK